MKRLRQRKWMALAVLGFALSQTGCAHLAESVTFGAGVGAAGGMGVGLLNQKSTGSALIGAGIGSILGGALGYLLHHDKPTEVKRTARSTENNDVPLIKMPEADCVQSDYRIEGTTYFGPQLKCTIEKSAVWSK
jgi:hypothetical protein